MGQRFAPTISIIAAGPAGRPFNIGSFAPSITGIDPAKPHHVGEIEVTVPDKDLFPPAEIDLSGILGSGDLANSPPAKDFGISNILRSNDVSFSSFRKRWAGLQAQVGAMLTDITQQSFGSMELDTLEVSLAVTGEGTIGIASSKAEASVVLTFKKKA
ncbi:MAG: hypothetical protein WCA81_07835 [Rhizomicrobium sp.]